MTDQNQALATRQESGLQKIAHAPDIVTRFADIMGGEYIAKAYIQDVLLTVAETPALQECAPLSIISSALRAASLRLSCDKATGQAWLVPFKQGGKSVATLIVGANGWYQMALRTNKYTYIQQFYVREGQTFVEDPIDGTAKIITGNDYKKSNRVIGYGLSWGMTNGFKKVFYMTREEMEAHAKKYSKSAGRDSSPWTTDFDKMGLATVTRLGIRKYGYIDPHDLAIAQEVEAEQEGQIIEAPIIGILPENEPEAATEQNPNAGKTEAQIQAELGFN